VDDRADASGLKELTFSLGFDGDPTWDPTGTKIAFETNRNGNFDVYVINADGSGQRRLTTDSANDADPAGRRRYDDRIHQRSQRFAADLDDAHRRLESAAADERSQHRRREPAWSPRGGQIAFDSDRGDRGNLEIWTMSSDGSKEQQVTDTPALDALPSYSPNGQSIVFESDRGAKNNRDLYVTTSRAATSTGCSRTAATGTLHQVGADLG